MLYRLMYLSLSFQIHALQHDPNEQIFMEFVSKILPLMDKFTSILFQVSNDCEHSHNQWNMNQSNFLCENDSKTCPSTASNGPKAIFSHGFSIKNLTFNINQFCINNGISCKTIYSKHPTVPSSIKCPPTPTVWAKTCRKAKSTTFLCNLIINFTNSSTHFNPCSVFSCILIIERRCIMSITTNQKCKKDPHSHGHHLEL